MDNVECVFIPAGNYTLANTVTVANNTKIIGNGTLVRASGNRYGDILHVTGCTLAISGITINDNGSTLPVFTSADYDIQDKRYVCIKVDNHAKIDVNLCVFNDVYTRAVDCFQAAGISICNNYMSTTTRNQGYVGEFIHILTCYCACVIEGNRMLCPDYNNPALGMCGVFVSGYDGGVRISNNYMRTVGRNIDYGHRLLPIDFYLNVNNMTVENNDITTAHGFIRIHGCTNISVRHNTVKKPGDYEDTANGDPFIWIYSNSNFNSSNIEVSYNNLLITKSVSIVAVNGDVGNSCVYNNRISFPEQGAPMAVVRFINNAKNFAFRNNMVVWAKPANLLLELLSNIENIEISGNNCNKFQAFCDGSFTANRCKIIGNLLDGTEESLFKGVTWNKTVIANNVITGGNVNISGNDTIITGNIIDANYAITGTAKAINNIKNNELYPA